MLERTEKHIYFGNVIGDTYIDEETWTVYLGTRLEDIQLAIGDYRAFGFASEFTPPTNLVLHFTKCFGGSVWEGYAQYNYLRELSRQGCKIEARVEGLCASIAVLIALAADTVNMSDVAQWMVHKPMAGDSSGLNADELRQQADQLDKVQAQLVGAYVARAGMSAAQANDLINRTSYLTADECIALGFVTGKLDQALKVPEGAEQVLNFSKPPIKPANTMAITPAEETRLVDKFIAAARNFFAPKNEEAVPPAPAPAPQNAATSLDVDGGDPMYFDGTDLAQGTAVYSDEAMTTAYVDGDYTLSDGRACTVASGSISSLTDAESEDNAENSAEELTAANAEVERLKAENALLNRKVTGLQNKYAKLVPGSAGNPNTPGSAQNQVGKKTASAPGARDAERSFLLPKK